MRAAARARTGRPEPTVTLVVELTLEETVALRDGVFTCTSADTRRHNAGRRALLKLREVADRRYPRPPVC
jgi:hypothetical protein